MRRGACALVLASLALPAVASAQGYRAEVRVTGRSIELRGLERDSLPEGEVDGDALRRRLPDGTPVACIPDEFCRWYPEGDEESTTLVTEDLVVAAWSGIQGLAAHVHLRGRYGSDDDLWPRTDQELEALTAYLSYERGDVRVRAGRQFRTNGLGYYNFDGASVAYRGLDPVRVDVYGGWSLARGLNAPRDGDLLSDADEFAPDDRALLVGADVSGRWGRVASGTFTYQREIRTDELALYTERVAFDGRARIARAELDLAVEYDLGFGEFNEVLARVTAPVVDGVWITAQGRRYAPFFELWTIWGAFAPIGYDEGRASVVWDVGSTGLRLEGGGAYRVYEETDAGANFVRLEEDGWMGFGGARYHRAGWFADASYRALSGSGAARFSGDAAVGREFGPGTYVALRGTSTQSFSEFRLGKQITSGGGVDGAVRIGDVDVVGGIGAYSLVFEDRPGVSDWTQVRGRLGISYRFGTEPAAPSGRPGGYR